MQSDSYDSQKFLDLLSTADKELCDIALSHPSYTAENGLDYTKCYERLEFLGDAVLKLIASEYLYKKFPHHKEGDLSKIRSYIVSDEVLAQVAEKLKINELIKTAKNDKSLLANESICACAAEALLGALYLSGKTEELKEFFEENFKNLIDDIDSDRLVTNPKAVLQEYTQGCAKKLPEYILKTESGADHNKLFCVEVSFDDKILAQGTGKTKKAAQQDAALKACMKLNLLEKST